MVCLQLSCLALSFLEQFSQLVNTNFLCPVVDNFIYPPDFAPILKDGDKYDFIIVGAGSAGSVLFNRLTESQNVKVLLIESGTYPDAFSEVPAFFPLTLQTPESWHYKSEVGEYCKGYIDGRCNWSKGRLLGGTSGVNAMLFVESNPQDHERWVNAGAIGWDWNTVEPYYRKLEDTTSGTGMKTIKYNFTSRFPVREILLDNNKFVDNKGSPYLGYFNIPTNIYKGKRYSTAKGYVAPTKNRINAHIALNTLAMEILFDKNSKSATGVRVNSQGRLLNLYATKEVIISAGPVNSPQLLMLSGIGPTAHLTSVGITPRIDLPVGENLQDHIYVPMLVKLPDHDALVAEVLEYCFNSSGTLAEVNVNNVLGFINTKNNSIYPNIEFEHYYLAQLTTDAYLTMALYNIPTSLKIAEIHLQNDILVIAVTLLNPKSVGRILLENNQITSPPLIYPNYLSDDNDYQLLLEGINFVKNILAINPGFFKSSLIDMGTYNCATTIYDSEEYWRCIIYNFATSSYHPVGTCKIGAVVDPFLRVKGASNLRVIDSSVIPLEVSGNTNVPTIMVAERGADLIKNSWTL